MQQLALEIGGMSCGHCVKAVNTALAAIDGVTVEQVAIGSATVAFDPARTSADRITQVVEDEGYQIVAAR
jgi:copper chaperone CopZ